jgi:hypothetical protein
MDELLILMSVALRVVMIFPFQTQNGNRGCTMILGVKAGELVRRFDRKIDCLTCAISQVREPQA